MRHRTPSFALALLLAVAPTATIAAEPGLVEPADSGTTVHLVEQVERQLPRDRLSAVLRVEAKGPQPAAVQTEVNRRMQAALDRAKTVAAVKVASGSYSVYRQPPVLPNNAVPDTWVASQTVTITATDFAPALALIGDLQAGGLVIELLAFEVAPETLRAAEDGMSDAALAALRSRAEHVAAAMGMVVTRYKSIDVGNATSQETRPPMPLRMAAMAKSGAPAAAEAGDATASLTVDAQVILEPKKAP